MPTRFTTEDQSCSQHVISGVGQSLEDGPKIFRIRNATSAPLGSPQACVRRRAASPSSIATPEICPITSISDG